MSLSVADKITNDRCLMICKMHVYSGLYNYTEVDIFSCTTLHGCFSSELQCVELCTSVHMPGGFCNTYIAVSVCPFLSVNTRDSQFVLRVLLYECVSVLVHQDGHKQILYKPLVSGGAMLDGCH